MNKLNWIISVSAAVFAICLCVAGWNAVATQQTAAITGSPPSAGQIGAVALPSLGAIAAGITSLLALISKVWKPSTPGETSLLQNLTALSTLMSWLGSKPLSGLLEAVKQNGWPSHGKIELGWKNKTPFKSEWSTPDVVTEVKS